MPSGQEQPTKADQLELLAQIERSKQKLGESLAKVKSVFPGEAAEPPLTLGEQQTQVTAGLSDLLQQDIKRGSFTPSPTDISSGFKPSSTAISTREALEQAQGSPAATPDPNLLQQGGAAGGGGGGGGDSFDTAFRALALVLASQRARPNAPAPPAQRTGGPTGASAISLALQQPPSGIRLR